MEKEPVSKQNIKFDSQGKPMYGWMREWIVRWDENRAAVRGLLLAKDARRERARNARVLQRLREEYQAELKEAPRRGGKFYYEHPDRLRELKEAMAHGGEHQRAGGQGTGNPENEPDGPG